MTRSVTPLDRLVTAVADDARQWGIPRWIAWALLLVPLLLTAAMMVLGYADEELFEALIDEDQPIESAQFFVILAASDRLRRCGHPGSPERPDRTRRASTPSSPSVPS